MQERKPELTSEIMAFRDSLLSSAVSDTLNVWELKGTIALSLKITKFIYIIGVSFLIVFVFVFL